MSCSGPFVHEACIRVTNIISFDHFYAQIGTTKLLKEFDEFSSELDNWGRGCSERSSRFPELQSYVLVKDGSSWFRAFVTDIMEKGVKVFLIDIGKSREVTNTDDICGRMPPQMLSLAQQALHCVLVDIKQKAKWSVYDVQAFRHLISRADELQCSVYPERDGKCPIVMYHREVGGTWKSVGASLEQLGVTECISIPEVKARLDQMNISYVPSLPKHPVMLSQRDSGITAMADHPLSNTTTAVPAQVKERSSSIRTQLSVSEDSDSECDSVLQESYDNVTMDHIDCQDEHGTRDVMEDESKQANVYSDYITTEDSTLASPGTPNIERSLTLVTHKASPPTPSPTPSPPPPLTQGNEPLPPNNEPLPSDSTPLSLENKPRLLDYEPHPHGVQIVPNIEDSSNSSNSSIDGDWDDALLTPSIPGKNQSDPATSCKEEGERMRKDNECTRKVNSPLLKTPPTGGSGYSTYNRTPRPKSSKPFTPFGPRCGNRKGPAKQHTPSFGKKETEKTFSGQGRGRGYARTRQPNATPNESGRRPFNASTSSSNAPTVYVTKGTDGIFTDGNTTHLSNNQPGVDRKDLTSRDQPIPAARPQVLTSSLAGLTSSEAVKNETDWLIYKIETETKKIQSTLPETEVFIDKVSLILNGSSARKLSEVSPSIKPISVMMVVLIKWIITNNAVDDDSVMKTIHELYRCHSEEGVSAAFTEACIRVYQDYCENSAGGSNSSAKREKFCCFLEKLYLHCKRMDTKGLLIVVIECLHSLVFNWVMKLSKKGINTDYSVGYVEAMCALCSSLGPAMDQYNRERLDDLFDCTIPNIITGDRLDQSLKLDLLKLLRNRDKRLAQPLSTTEPFNGPSTRDEYAASTISTEVTQPLRLNGITSAVTNPGVVNEAHLPSSDNRTPSNRPIKVLMNSPISSGYGELSNDDCNSSASNSRCLTGVWQRRVIPSSPSPHPQGYVGSRNFTLTPDPLSIGLFKGAQPLRSHSYDGTSHISGGALSPPGIGFNPMSPNPILTYGSPDDSYNLVSTMLYNLKLTEFLPVFKSAKIQDSVLTIGRQELKDVLKEIAIPPGAIVSILQYVAKSLESQPEPERNQFFPQQSSTCLNDDAASIVHTASPEQQHQPQDTTYVIHESSHGMPPPLVPQKIKPIREPQEDPLPPTKPNTDQNDGGGREVSGQAKPSGTRGFGMNPMCVMCGSREHRGYACPKRAELLFADQPKLT